MKMWRSFMSSRLRSMRDHPDRISLFKTVGLLHQPCVLGICSTYLLGCTATTNLCVSCGWSSVVFCKMVIVNELSPSPISSSQSPSFGWTVKAKKKKKNPDWIETSNPILYKMVASLPVRCQCLMLELNLLSFSPTVLCMLFLSDIPEDCLESKKKF